MQLGIRLTGIDLELFHLWILYDYISWADLNCGHNGNFTTVNLIKHTSYVY